MTTAPVAPKLGEHKSLHRLIGNTPLLALALRFRGRPLTIYAKSEQMNLTGSIKD